MLPHKSFHQAIIWDLDGTLVESAPDLAKALGLLLNEQDLLGHPVELVRTMIGGGVPKLIERGFRSAGKKLDSESRDALVPRFMEIYMTCCAENTTLMPGARDALLSFYNAGVIQGICTNKPYEVTRRILHNLDVFGFFDSIVGGDSTAVQKPNPLPLQTCLEELDVRAEDAVMVGDSATDVKTARALDMPVILVANGYTAIPAAELGADYVVENLSELPGNHLVGNIRPYAVRQPAGF